MALADVVHAIHVAFPVRPRPRATQITDDGDEYFERLDLRRGLKGRSWKAVPPDYIRRERSFVWLAPAGFGYYLPAWLCVACRDSDVREATLYNLRNYRHWIRDGLADPDRDHLTPPQLAAIVMFLEHWAIHGSDIGPDDEAASARDALAGYWRARAANGQGSGARSATAAAR